MRSLFFLRNIALVSLLQVTLFLAPQSALAGCCTDLKPNEPPTCNKPDCAVRCWTEDITSSCLDNAQPPQSPRQWNSGACRDLAECADKVQTTPASEALGDCSCTTVNPEGPAFPTIYKDKTQNACSNLGGVFTVCDWQKSTTQTPDKSFVDTVAPISDFANRTPNTIIPTLSVPIPGVAIGGIGGSVEKGLSIPFVGQYLAGIYAYVMGIAGTLAVVMMVIGGIKYLTAGGNNSQTTSAKDTIRNALLGLVLVMGTHLILRTINPALVQFKALNIAGVKPAIFDIRSMKFQETAVVDEEAIKHTGSDVVESPCGNIRRDRLFTQYDSRWGNQVYGPQNAVACPGRNDQLYSQAQCCTIYTYAGCGAAAIATVLAEAGAPVTPPDVGTFISTGAQSMRSCNVGTAMTPSSIAAFNTNNSWGKTLQNISFDDTKKSLKECTQPVGFYCNNCQGVTGNGDTRTYGGHWMVFVGLDSDGKFVVHDVGNGAGAKGIVSMTEDQVKSSTGGYFVAH